MLHEGYGYISIGGSVYGGVSVRVRITVRDRVKISNKG